MLLIGLLRHIRNGFPRACLLNPFYLRSMVRSDRSVVYLAKTLAEKEADHAPKDKVWDKPLCMIPRRIESEK